MITAVSLLSSATYWGYLIYGGVQWGRWKDGFDLVSGTPQKMTQAALAMWVCSLVFPVLAPYICACCILGWTSGSKCDEYSELFAQAYNDSQLLEDPNKHAQFQIWYKLNTQSYGQSGERVLQDIICKETFKVLLAFVIMSSLLVIFVPLLICSIKGTVSAGQDMDDYE